MRLGSAGPSHGAPLRRDGEGVQRLARAAWFRTRARRARRAERAGRVHRRRLSQRARHSTTCSCRSGCWSMSACATSTVSPTCCAARVRRQGGRGLLHFIGRDVPYPLNRVDSTARVPRRVSANPGRGHLARARAGRDVGCRRREPAPALCAHARILEGGVCRRLRPGPDDLWRGLPSARGSCTWPALRPRLPPGGCSCSRSCSRHANRRRRRGLAPSWLQPTERAR